MQRPLFQHIVENVGPEKYNAFLDSAQELVHSQTFKRMYDNYYEQQVIDIIKEEFADHEIEYEVQSGYYPYDVYFPKEKLIVEINGSSHFYNITTHKLGKYELKKKLFEAVGLNYIDLDFHEYQQQFNEVVTENYDQFPFSLEYSDLRSKLNQGKDRSIKRNEVVNTIKKALKAS